MEILSAFIACNERRYTDGILEQQRELCHSALRSLNGYIRYVRGQQQGRQEYGERVLKEDAPQYKFNDLDLDEPIS
ncbi:MAG: hypothetical protein OHK003_24190 [Anaerolineales bacterium]